MIIDTSAIMAILLQEPEAKRIAEAITHDSIRLISTANWLEISLVVFTRTGNEGLRDFDLLIAKCRISSTPVTIKHAEIARHAFLQYGKGRHPAKLNYGDCFAYALAKETNEPLLFKGNDFNKTDITVVHY
ncbi:MAG: type II toxin-antitoxin system VapC family toxin [Deltaproteobacteria bacterium]|nr:type II toxin-antitoxin system VapC family toxin [Deltaproteobacteria bacterium]